MGLSPAVFKELQGSRYDGGEGERLRRTQVHSRGLDHSKALQVVLGL